MYEIRRAGLKGLGVFALNPIPRGTRIFSERPLLAISQTQDASNIFSASQLLSLADRSKLLSLSSHATRELNVMRWGQALWFTLKAFSFPRRKWMKEHVTILSIFRSNAFALGPKSVWQQAVFPRISRINHSCVPNAQGNFHEGDGRFNVHATRNIERGEELTLNYLPENGSVRELRQGRLWDGYGFECGCQACDLSTVGGKRGEERRADMLSALRAYAEGEEVGGVEGVEKELEIVETLLRVFQGEGIAGREVSVLYFEAARLCEKLARRDDALRFAKRGLNIDRDCLGEDHELYLESVNTVETLERQL